MTERNLMHAITVLFAVGFIVYGCALLRDSKGSVATDATCSPRADAEFAAALVATCKGKLLSECPEADGIGDTYEKKAEEECSKQ